MTSKPATLRSPPAEPADIRKQRQLEATDKLLEHLGTGDITPEDLAAVIAEWRGSR